VRIICLALGLYQLAVLAWVVLSWVNVSTAHAVGKVQAFLDRIILPVVRPIRKVIKPIRLGGGLLDLSPIILLLGLNLLQRSIC